jgi:hypothetical protein
MHEITVILLLLVLLIIIFTQNDDSKSKFSLYAPTCGGIDRAECTGLTSGNMPVIDAEPFDWFRSQPICSSFGVPP